MELNTNQNNQWENFELNILKKDEYVIECLQQAGLDTSKLSPAAKDIIVEDFRKFYSTITSINNVTDIVKKFVDHNGNYSRAADNLYIGTLVLEPNDDGTFVVKTTRDIDADIESTERCLYSSIGIELRRERSYSSTTVDFNNVVDTITRNDDLVTLTIKRTKNNTVLSETTSFVNPLIKSGRTLELGDGYTRFSEGFVETRSPEEIKIIGEYLQLITGLSRLVYTKTGECYKVVGSSKVVGSNHLLNEELVLVDLGGEKLDGGMGL